MLEYIFTKKITSILIIAFLCNSIIFAFPRKAGAQSENNWAGLMLSASTASIVGGPEVFFSDFEELALDLKNRGINTIIFMMSHQSYHYSCGTDIALCSIDGEDEFSDVKRMADIVRQNNMRLVIGFQILTHQNDGPPAESLYMARPEYMLAGNDWQSGKQYRQWKFVKYGGVTYKCIQEHTSDSGNAPPNLTYWKQEASNTRDPFNTAAEQLTFRMMDELISAFTATDGTKPAGFIAGGDEMDHFYDDPVARTGKTAAEIYAMVFNNAYNYIKSHYPNMEVIMYGDMLDPHWNGGPVVPNYDASRDTAGATNYLNKNIIITDWRYDESENNPTRFNKVTKTFPSLGEFIDKGFRVWPLGWSDVLANRDLIWTENMEQARTGKIMGHSYATFTNHGVDELPKLLNDPNYVVPDSIASTPEHKAMFRGIADSINQTASLIGLKQCRGTDYYCGAYPNCVDCNQKDGLYGSAFRDYSCENNTVKYDVTNFPGNYVSYWKFNGNANDEKGQNNAFLMNGASIVNDATRGQTISFDGVDDFVRVPDSNSLDMGRGSLSISAWFKAGPGELGTIVAKGPNLNNYTLFLDEDGRLLLETNGGNFYRHTADGVSYRDNKWHHAVVIFDSSGPGINFYVDNVLANGTKMYIDGTNEKSSIYDLFIGSSNGSGQYQFQGQIDDVMIFNRAISAAEVTSIYANQGGESNVVRLTPSNYDINEDFEINSLDFALLKTDFLKLTVALSNPRSDINGDGQATVKDVGILMSGWQ